MPPMVRLCKGKAVPVGSLEKRFSIVAVLSDVMSQVPSKISSVRAGLLAMIVEGASL